MPRLMLRQHALGVTNELPLVLAWDLYGPTAARKVLGLELAAAAAGLPRNTGAADGLTLEDDVRIEDVSDSRGPGRMLRCWRIEHHHGPLVDPHAREDRWSAQGCFDESQ